MVHPWRYRDPWRSGSTESFGGLFPWSPARCITPPSVFILVKAGGMRIVQKHPHSGDTKEEKDKDDQEWESPR